jgi:Fic family protein
MPWNWELPEWPKFTCDPGSIAKMEREFLLQCGGASAYLKNIETPDFHQFVVEILSSEGLESFRIEGEVLDRQSLQSSIKRHFGLAAPGKKEGDREARMANVLCSVYDTFKKPLSDDMLCQWHLQLFQGNAHIDDCGRYRTHREPMQIVSGRFGSETVFFEAPPSRRVPHEMDLFIKWFNSKSTSLLGRAAIAHLYFETIHPFEDGNGRLGRLLVEKILSQGIGRPILIAVSKVLERRKKEYYAALQACNRTLDIQSWVEFFAEVICQSQKESMTLLHFLIEKSKMMRALEGHINPRQEKALLRMFEEGPAGFKGGLSAENYIAITKASRATATRDLADLVQKGALTKTGQLRHARYWVKRSV